MSVRRSKDVALVAKLDSAIFRDVPPVDVDGAIWWIARVDGAPAGFAGLATHPEFPGTAYLRRAGVAWAYRGHGLHDRMINARVRWARTHGFDSVVTYTMPDNWRSANNLADKGFRLFEPDYPYVGDGVLYWRKAL